jgi:SH3-like domain-containing protein
MARHSISIATLASASLALAAAPAAALDFRAIADPGAILYDAPSAKAQKLFVLSRDYPVEVIVKVEGWTKVRDDNGEFAWVENKQLSDKRTVMVKSSSAEARQAPSDTAAMTFTAEKGVLLDLLETAAGWAKVRHPDGEVAYIKLGQLWGV